MHLIKQWSKHLPVGSWIYWTSYGVTNIVGLRANILGTDFYFVMKSTKLKCSRSEMKIPELEWGWSRKIRVDIMVMKTELKRRAMNKLKIKSSSVQYSSKENTLENWFLKSF